MSEAYSHEVISCGFWPGDRKFSHPAFYAYALPTPAGIDKEPHWDAQLGEFILPYDTVRKSPAGGKLVMDFLQASYAAAADLGKWDRAALDCATGRPGKPRIVE